VQQGVKLSNAGDKVCCDFNPELFSLDCVEDLFEEVELSVSKVDEINQKVRTTVFVAKHSHALHLRVEQDIVEII
jgi:hypothetical protein